MFVVGVPGLRVGGFRPFEVQVVGFDISACWVNMSLSCTLASVYVLGVRVSQMLDYRSGARGSGFGDFQQGWPSRYDVNIRLS